MSDQETIIHIEWDGPCSLQNVQKDLIGPSDYGVYQIYGGHPVYGSSALLYIGLAAAQSFGERIPREKQWLDNRDAGRIEVYIGRLSGSETPANDTWERNIKLAERLLIYAHAPPHNTQKSLANLEPDLRFVRVLNWGKHRDLLPEVSGARWSSRFDDIPNYHPFREKPAEAKSITSVVQGYDPEAILKRLTKLKPTNRVKAINSITAMFQFTAPITAAAAGKILDDIEKRGALIIDAQGKIRFKNPR
jgi:hypothetical protein